MGVRHSFLPGLGKPKLNKNSPIFPMVAPQLQPALKDSPIDLSSSRLGKGALAWTF